MYEILVVFLLCTLLIIKHFNVIWWTCMQEKTKLKTIREGFFKSFATQAKRKIKLRSY